MRKIISLTGYCIVYLASNQSIAQCFPDQSNTYWKIGSGFGTTRVSDCNPSYNCHGFTMSYFDPATQCQPSPFIYYSPAYSCPTSVGIKGAEWKTNGKYVRVCTEADAKIAYYEGGAGMSGGHSAVKVVQGGTTKYISKYGADGPLVSHNLNGSWYHNDNNGVNRVTSTEFWTHIGSIPESGTINGTGNRTYSVLSGSGLSYSWSIVSGGENIYISSGANQSTVTLSPLHSGNATLQITVTTGCGSIVQQKALTIQTNICLEGTYLNNSSTVKNLNTGNSVAAGWVNCTVTCPNAASYTWQRTSGTISFYSSGNFLSFNITSGSSVSFNVVARNSSNAVIGNRNISFYNYGSFAVSPNPASSSLKVDALEDAPLSVAIIDLKGNCMKEISNYSGKSNIDVTDLKDGEYIVNIYVEGKLANQERVKIAH